MRTFVQKLGKTLMGPLSIIVASGLLLGIVSILTNVNIVGESFANAQGVQAVVGAISALVGMMFSLLPILFAISVATGMAKEDKEVSAFAVVICFVLFHVMIGYLLKMNGITADNTTVEYLQAHGMDVQEAYSTNSIYDTQLGIFTYRMGIFGGIITGLWTAFIHNRFHKQKLPIAFSFFSGNRFVPVMIIATVPFLGIVSYFLWPLFSTLINGVGTIIGGSGAIGMFIYGFSERLLIPTDLHHVLNQLIRFTPIGGSAVVDGQMVTGALSIFQAELASKHMDLEVFRAATKFLSQGTAPFMIFGLPGACLAMYKTSYQKERPKVKGMLVAAALTSFATGITEPIEFSFIFISPVLWIFHAAMAGMSFMLMSLLHVGVGNAAYGFVDLFTFGILQGTWTRWYFCVLLGIVYFFAYYFVFKYVIEKKNLKTPGRDLELDNTGYEEKNAIGSKEASEIASKTELGGQILEAIGGKENVREIDNCISRLRLILEDAEKVDEKSLKKTGAMGVIKINKNNVQIVYGAKVEEAAQALKSAVGK